MNHTPAVALRAPGRAIARPGHPHLARGPGPMPLRAPERKSAGGLMQLELECELKFDDAAAGEGTIEGYASKWDLLDRGGDIVRAGAFKKSIARWKKQKAMPPMLWQHDPHTPIGVWLDLFEDDVGLYAKGQLFLDIPKAAECRALIKGKAVRGLSIGYLTMDSDYDRATGARFLKEVDLWEISPVTFPMLPEALIAGVKSDFDPRQLEQALREEAGLSHNQAKAAVSILRKHTLRDVGANEPGSCDGKSDVLMAIRRTIADLQA